MTLFFCQNLLSIVVNYRYFAKHFYIVFLVLFITIVFAFYILLSLTNNTINNKNYCPMEQKMGKKSNKHVINIDIGAPPMLQKNSNNCYMDPQKSNNKIPRSLRYDLENALLGVSFLLK